MRNQLTTLLSRHAGNLDLRYRHEAPVETTASMLTAALSILCQAIHTLPNFTDLPAGEVTSAVDDADTAWTLACAGES
jgi:hypothetical protein